jgi:tetratricopeptide (TPR) repeat protein
MRIAGRWLNALRISHLSHSTDPADRALAKQIVQEKLGMQGNKSEFSIENLNKINSESDLLSYMLDAYHRDGLHDDALKIATELKEQFPQSSLALRNYARALEKKGESTIDELIVEYRKAIVCEDTDDTSALWYAGTLESANRLVDAVEALVFGCMLDLDESKSYARLAVRLSDIVQPRNLLRLTKTKRELPKEYLNEDIVKRCILLCRSCPNFGVEDKFLCESAMRNIGLTDDAIQELLDEVGSFSRRDRKEFVIPFYEAIQSNVTVSSYLAEIN